MATTIAIANMEEKESNIEMKPITNRYKKQIQKQKLRDTNFATA